MNILRTAVLLIFVQNLQPLPSASIQGVVVKVGTNNGLSKAIVQLRKAEDAFSMPRQATTTEDGKFSFRNLAPGRYLLSSTRNGFVPAEYRESWPNNPVGIPITVMAGEEMTNVQIAMRLAAAIYGHVYDRTQHPLGNADVQAVKLTYEAGKRVLKFVRSVTTNDLGEYRLFSLPPGRYYVSALLPEAGRYRPPGGGQTGAIVNTFAGAMMWARASVTTRRTAPPTTYQYTYVPIFFPDTPDEQTAVPIDLATGADFGSLDLTVFSVQKQSVRGVIINGITGQPAQNGRIFVFRSPARYNDIPYTGADSAIGSFDVSSLLPGSYVLVATAGDLTGRALIDVNDRDLDDVTVVVTTGFRIPGRVVIDGDKPGPAGLRVSLRPDPEIRDFKLPDPPQNGVAASDGSLSLMNVPIGDYRIDVSLPPNLHDAYIKSVRLGTVDVLRDGLHIAGQPAGSLEVVVGTKPGALEGRIVNQKREPSPGATVVLVPDVDQRLRMDLYHSTSTDASGQFRFDRLAPGNYKLFAWEEVEREAWTDPEFLRPYEDEGIPARISEGILENAEAVLIPSR